MLLVGATRTTIEAEAEPSEVVEEAIWEEMRMGDRVAREEVGTKARAAEAVLRLGDGDRG